MIHATAHRRSRWWSAPELERDLRPQIGDALARQPGVSASSFGPNASRPILRGLAGERVRVLTDGIGAFDVSNTSADHAVAIDPLLADRIEVSGGGSLTDTGDLRTGGPLLAAPLRAEAQASSDSAVRALAGLAGRLPNSGSRTRTADLGAAMIDERGDLGFAVTRCESVYGLPIRYDRALGAEQEAVSIDAEQWRADLRGSVVLAGDWLERLSFRGGYADYAHVEREGGGGIGTLFANEGIEARAELKQRRRGGWQGVSDVQFFARDSARSPKGFGSAI